MVYVDNLRPCIPNPSWRWRYSCHLYADTEEELHAFAKKIGLKRIWFQSHRLLDHYDLTSRMRQKAVRLGAIELDTKDYLRNKKHVSGQMDGNPEVGPDGEAQKP